MKEKKEPLIRIDVLTLFPDMFAGPFRNSMVRLAKEKGLVKIRIIDIRRFSKNKHRKCDDTPYGGGPGMVMNADPIFSAIEHAKKKSEKALVVLMTPQGEPYHQKKAWDLSRDKHLIFLCGHYEGVDERVVKHAVDAEISVGDFVTTGGEVPAMAVIESIVRLVPGVVGNQVSLVAESFENKLLDHPHYTRPREYRGWEVPDVLLSGDHKKIEKWRRDHAVAKTKRVRPDLWQSHEKKRS